MLTIIESPFAGDRERNDLYLKRAILDSVNRGEIPFASHGFYTHFLDDADPVQRALGIELGYAFWEFADKLVFYTDYGISSGMDAAITQSVHRMKRIEMRRIGTNDDPHPLP